MFVTNEGGKIAQVEDLDYVNCSWSRQVICII